MRTEQETNSLKTICNVFSDLLGYDCEIDDIQYQHWDINVTGTTGTGKLEVKQRNLTLPELKKYSNEGLYLQKDKYDNLINLNSMYINYFDYEDFKIILCWNIKKVDTNTLNTQWMTDSQEFSKTGGKKVPKQVYNCYLNDSIKRMVYINNEWSCVNKSKLMELIDYKIKEKLITCLQIKK